MAAPVIRAIAIDPPVVGPGGSATITIDAFDPDSGTAVVTVEVTDSSGNKTSGQASIAINDPLSFAVSASRGTVKQDSQRPNVWVWTDAA